MKLILQRSVGGLGEAGDIVDVANGFGRNYLVPRGDAIVWSKGAEKQITGIKRARDAREIRDRDHAVELKTQLEALDVTLTARAGSGGKLFGSITDGAIADAVKAAGGPTLDRKRINHDQIRSTGAHQVSVDLHPDVVATVALTVTAQ